MAKNRASSLMQGFRRRFFAPPSIKSPAAEEPTGEDSLGTLPIILVDKGADSCCSLDDQLSCSTFTISDTTTIRTSFSSKRSLVTYSKSSQQRRVRFAQSRNGDGGVLTDVHVIVSYPGERTVPLKNASEPICHFAKFQEDALKAVAEETCRALLDSLDKMYFGMVFSDDADSEGKRMKGMAEWSKIEGGKYRGLEATLMKRAHKRRIGHRNHVLEKQKTLKSEGPFLRMDERLRRASRKYTRASAEFSMLLAVGDSIALHGHDQALNDHEQHMEQETVAMPPSLLSCDTKTRAEL